MKKLSLCVLAAMLLCAFSLLDSSENEIVRGTIGQKIEAELEPFLHQIRKDHDCETAISIGVTKGEEIIYAKTFGYANIETQNPADNETVYHLASLSKPFTAAALVQLELEGKLTLDDPIVKHLPYFKLKSPEYSNITIRQVLTHTSGLPSNVGKDEWEDPDFSEGALKTYVEGLTEAELEFVPGSSYNYSNTAYNILGAVIAAAAGESFESYLQKAILKPAGMLNATFSKAPGELPENWAAPHIIGTTTQVWDYYPYNRRYAPSSALHANILDMCRWGILNLKQGKYQDRQLLDAKIFTALMTPEADTPWGDKVGLSWFLQSYEGMKTVLHTGEDIGFSTQIILYPEEDISITILSNRAYSRTARLTNAVIEVIKDLGIKSYNTSARFPFCRTWEQKGPEAAELQWIELLQDTTDNYYAGEWEMNGIGHGLIFTKEYEKAKTAFQINIDAFPNSPNVYDSYGDALLAEGDTTQAIVYFKKALEVNPDFPDPKPKLEKLK